MDESLTHEEKEIIKRALRGLMVSLIAFMLTRNVTQADLPAWQLSISLGMMACFQSMFGFVRVALAIVVLEVLFPIPIITELIKHF